MQGKGVPELTEDKVYPLSMFRVEGTMTTKVHLTESEERIRDGIASVFPDIRWHDTQKQGIKRLMGSFHDTSVFKEKLAQQRIRNSARDHLRDNIFMDEIRIRLNKQALAVGKINFALTAQPLGVVKLTISVSPSSFTDLPELEESPIRHFVGSLTEI